MKRWLPFPAAVLLCAAALQAQAFCIVNETHKSHRFQARVHIYAAGHRQASGRDFSTDIGPGKEGCCHWTNRNCNASGKRDAMLEADFSVHVPARLREGFTYRCASWRDGSRLQADGRARIHQGVQGDPAGFYVTTFTFDGKLDQQFKCNVR